MRCKGKPFFLFTQKKFYFFVNIFLNKNLNKRASFDYTSKKYNSNIQILSI
ncbi:hypothetical protein CCAND38_230035 [Capnocytophaga canis]|uniref:Uncharacterized protein n=1 Tax=Capnocytophaga canis TaxID=1848903 RepID=A0A0B7I3C7_9FLAO|nr:hypothetical protein CCAND38_230035 [Capnocytophaga canis]